MGERDASLEQSRLVEHCQLTANKQEKKKNTRKGLHLLYPFKKDTSGLWLEVAAGNQTHTEGLPSQINSHLLRYLSPQQEISMGVRSLPKSAGIFKREGGRKLDLKHLSPDGTSKNAGPQTGFKPCRKRKSNEQLSRNFQARKNGPLQATMQATLPELPPDLSPHGFLWVSGWS